MHKECNIEINLPYNGRFNLYKYTYFLIHEVGHYISLKNKLNLKRKYMKKIKNLDKIKFVIYS